MAVTLLKRNVDDANARKPTTPVSRGGNRGADIPVSRGGNGGADIAAALRRYVDLQAELSAAQRNTALQSEGNSVFTQHMARQRERRIQAQIDEAGRALTAAPAHAVAAAAPITAPDPVVSVPTQPTAPATATPTPPTAVTDPASEISPEEQNARLRARILLMNAGSRAGRLIQTMGSQLGFRSLTGL